MTAPAIMTDHPSDQTLASFADHRLGPEQHAAVVKHLADCGECLFIVQTAQEFNRSEGGSVVQFAPRRPLTALAIAAAIALAVVALPDVREWITYQRTGGKSMLVEAYSKASKRPIESRLSDALPYKDYVGPKRGPEDEDPAESLVTLRLENAEAKLQESNANGSWRELQVLAAAQLLVGKRDEAVKTLELAVKKAGEEKPELLNDLAAAHLERARYQAPGAVEAALRYAERAWALEKTPEIAFNRALAYRAAHREADKKRAWQDYLALDSTSPWAEEVRSDYLREDF